MVEGQSGGQITAIMTTAGKSINIVLHELEKSHDILGVGT